MAERTTRMTFIKAHNIKNLRGKNACDDGSSINYETKGTKADILILLENISFQIWIDVSPLSFLCLGICFKDARFQSGCLTFQINWVLLFSATLISWFFAAAVALSSKDGKLEARDIVWTCTTSRRTKYIFLMELQSQLVLKLHPSWY